MKKEKGVTVNIPSVKTFVSKEAIADLSAVDAATAFKAVHEAVHIIKVPHHGASQAAPKASELGKVFGLGIARAVWILSIVAREKEQSLPPKFGEALLLLFCHRDLADAIAGDLQEKFEADILSAGLRRARFRYWVRIVRSAAPLIFTRLRNWGLFAAALEYGRRKIGL